MSRVEAIDPTSIEETASFLHRHLNSRIPIEVWAGILNLRGRKIETGNAGFLLRYQGQVVGVYGAVYAERKVEGRNEVFCNLHSWCVLEAHRSESMALLRALLGQKGLHFYAPTTSPLTAPFFEVLRFRYLDPRLCMFFNLPRPARGQLVSHPARLEKIFQAETRRIFEDHRSFPWIEQLALGEKDQWCHLLLRKRRWKGLGCAEVLYLENPALFLRYRSRLQRWLFLHRRLPILRVEARFFEQPPSKFTAIGHPQMVLSRSMKGRDFLNLYTDRVALATDGETP